MSKMVLGSCKIMIVEPTGKGMKTEGHAHRLDAVLAMIDNGSLGGGICYGCPEHIAALSVIEEQISNTRENIEKYNRYDI